MTVKRGLLNLLIGIIGLAIIIFIGWFLATHAENIFYSPLIPDHRVRHKGFYLMASGILSIYGVIFSNIIEIFTRNRVVDVPEYARLLEGVFEDKGSRKLRRNMEKTLIRYDAKRFKSALKKLDVLLEQCRNDREKRSVYTLMGMCHEGLKKYDKAAESYEAALAEDSDSVAVLECLARAQKMAGMYPQAIPNYLRLIELDSDNVQAYIDIAEIHLDTENYEGAVEYADKALEISENFGDAYRILCLAYRALGNKVKCRENYNLYRMHGGKVEFLWKIKNWFEEDEHNTEKRG